MGYSDSYFKNNSYSSGKMSDSSYLSDKGKTSLEEKIRKQEAIAKRQKIKLPGEKNKTTLFDVLEAPRYAVTNSIYTMLKEYEGDGLSFEDTGKVLKSAMYGFALKEKRNTKDLLKEYVPGKSELFYTTVGLAGDILTDPLTYMSFGARGGAKGAVEATKKANQFVGTKTRMVANAIKKEAKDEVSSRGLKLIETMGVETYEEAVKKKLIEKFGGKTWQEAIERGRRSTLKEAGDYGLRVRLPFQKNGLKIASGTPADMLGGAMRKFGIDGKALDVVENIPEHLGKIPGVAKFRKIFDTTAPYGVFKEGKDLERASSHAMTARLDNAFENVKTFDRQLEAIVKKSNTDPGLANILKDVPGGVDEKKKRLFNYLRDMVDEGTDDMIHPSLRGIRDDVKGMFDEVWGEIRKRGILDETAKRKNYFPRYYANQKTGEIVDKIKFKKVNTSGKYQQLRHIPTLQEARALGFEPLDAVDCLENYLKSAVKTTSSHDLAKGMVKKYGSKIGKDKTVSDDFVKVSVKGFKDYIVPKEIGHVLNQVDEIITNPTATNGFVKAFDKVQHFWKKQATIYNPGFHARNLYSNIFTGMMKDGAGVQQTKNLAKAFNIFTKGAKGSTKTVMVTLDGKKVKKTYKEVFDLMTSHGVNTGFWKGSEVDTLGKFSDRLKHHTLGTLDKTGSYAGAVVENTSRIASALNDLDKGIPLKQSVKRVNQYFFDYSDLTETEKKFKRFVPFYTWMRKNVPQQLSLIVENPGKYTALTSKPMRALDGFTDDEQEILPDFMQGNYINPLGMENANGNKLAWNPNLPFQDIGKINFARPIKSALDMTVGGVTPLIKAPIELGMNKSLFLDKPIAYDEYDKDVAPPAVEAITRTLPEDVRMKLGIDQDEHGRVIMPSKWIYAFTSLVPYFSKGGNVRTAITGEGEEWEKDKALPGMLSSLVGVSVKPVDMDYYREKHFANKLSKMGKANSAKAKSDMNKLKRAGYFPKDATLKNFKKLKGFN